MAGRLTTTVRLGGKVVNQLTEYPRGRNEIFGVTNNAIYARATPSRMGQMIAEALVGYAIDSSSAARGVENEIKVMAKAIEHAGNVEARRIIDFVTSKMIGIQGARNGVSFKDGFFKQGQKNPRGGWKPAFPIGGEIGWEALSLPWLHRKSNTKFFEDKGDLRREMRGLRASYPEKLGGVKVTAKTRGKIAQRNLRRAAQDGSVRKVAFGELTIQIFPNASASLFPGLMNGRWDTYDSRALLEASSFVPQGIGEKLAGPRQGGYAYRFRPMLGPVTQFWIMHRIPSAIAVAIQNGVRVRSQEGYQRPSRDALGMPMGPSDPRRI